MFLKLIKNEIKQSWLGFLIVYSTIIVCGVLLGLVFNANKNSDLLGVLATILFCSIFVAIGMIFYNVANSIIKKLFSQQGYLTFTTPATIDQILWSKILVNLLWIACAYLVGYSAIILSTMIAPDMIKETINEIARMTGFDILGEQFWITFGKKIIDYTQVMIMLVLTLAILFIGKIKKGKVFIGALIYSETVVVVNILSNVVPTIIDYSVITNLETGIVEIVQTSVYYEGQAEIGMLLFSTLNSIINFNEMLWIIISAIGGYFLARYLLKNKLEME